MSGEEGEDNGKEGGPEVEGNDSESLHNQISTALVNALIGHGHVPLIATNACSVGVVSLDWSQFRDLP